MTTASNSRVLRIIPLLLIMILFCPFAYGKIFYVDDDGQADFDNIQTGIDWAIDGDTIIVAPGTYTGLGNHDINFQGKAITVRSTDPNDQAIIASTIIDCQGQGRGFTFESEEQTDSILEGVIITNGKAMEGGGIFIWNSSPTIRNCTIKDNRIITISSGDGGGIFIWDGSPIIVNCTISGNSTREREYGGGIYIHGDVQGSKPTISQCLIIGNTAGAGGGLCIHESNPLISHCTIADNYAVGGGGLYIGGMGWPDEYVVRLENCRIIDNTANSLSGGLYTILCTLQMSNCVISGNSLLHGSGGGLSISTWTIAEIDRCTIVGNKVVEVPPGVRCAGGGLYFQMCDVKISNSIIRRNRATKGAQLAINAWDGVQSPNEPPIEDPTLVTLLYNDFNSEQDEQFYIYGEPNRLTLEMNNNLDIDPCFANTGFWDPNGTPDDPNDDFWVDGDYHLKSQAGRFDPNNQSWIIDDVTSPCIDAGDPNSPIGSEPFPNGGIINMGAYGGTSEASKSLSGKSTYIFMPEQSMVIQTGGIAGVNWTYTLTGQFQLTIDFGAGKAWFSNVEATATDESAPDRKLDLNEVFNLTGLTGTIDPDGSIQFTGHVTDGSEINLDITLSDESVSLKGQTTPPPNSADFFIFDLDAVAQRKYGGGTGELDNPYLIYTAEHLNSLGAEPNDWYKHFKLMADIDLAGYSYDHALIAQDIDTDEYYFQGTPFAGVFDGNGHTISHLKITGVSCLGLFGELAYGAELKDLGVTDVNISGSGDFVGGLLGRNSWGAVVIRCYSTGKVNGDDDIGGLVGSNHGNITQCYSSSAASGDYIIGGLLGGNEQEGTLTNCYSTGAINGNDALAGLLGFNLGEVTHCYCIGTVAGNQRLGGLVGWNYGDVASNFWDIQTSGRTNMCGSQEESASGCDDSSGLITTEMQMISTFLEAGWDFIDETANGTEDIWLIIEGQDYPRLWWETK